MGTILSYSIISSIALIGLWAIYRLIFAKRTDFSFNRAILLSFYLIAAIIPLVVDSTLSQNIQNHALTITTGSSTNIFGHSSDSTYRLIIAGYAIGALLMLISTTASWIRLILISRQGESTQHNDYTLIVTRKGHAPFSWMRRIFIDRSDIGQNTDMIIAHERAHISHCHYIDMIIAQFSLIILWYNPVAWLLRRELTIVHEYQVDSDVINAGTDRRNYQMMLLSKVYNIHIAGATENLYNGSIQSRIAMMGRAQCHTSRITTLFIVPAIIATILLTGYSSMAASLHGLKNATLTVPESIDMIEIQPQKASNLQDDTPTYKVNGKIIDKNDINNINPADIKNITVIRKGENTVLIETK